MANFALNYSFSRNLPIPLDEDAVKATLAEVVDYVKTKGKCYEGQLFSVTGETGDNVINNGLYIALSKGENGKVIKLATQEALDAVAASAGKIDKIQLNGTELTINDKVVNIDLSDYATTAYVDDEISKLSDVYAPKAEFEEVQKKVEDITSVGGEPNVQSDWNTVDTESDSFIKNKPDLSVYATTKDLNDAKDEINETITGLSEVYASKTVVETLVGSDVDKSARDIAAEEVAKVVADANADFDTLKEISDWILNDTTGAAHMANDIKALKQEDIAIDERLDVLEGVKHSHTNKEVLDGITETKVSSWDAAEQNAKDYADGLASNYDVAGAAASAETAAKAYADGLYNTATAYTDTKVSEANSAATVYTNTKISEANTYAENKALEALNNAKTYAEGLGIKYDSVGSASGALATAKLYADNLKNEAIESAKTYTDDVIESAKTDINKTIDSVSAETNTLIGGLSKTISDNKADAEEYANSVAKTAREIAEANASAYTNAEIAKLTNVYAPKAEFEEVQKKVDEITSTGGEPNVQSDWNTVDTESDSFIKNKPDLSVYATKNELTGATSDINEAIIKSYTSATTYFESEINSLSNVYAPKTVVETLVGDDADKSVRNIATEEVAKVVAEAPEAFDTLKEIAEWIGNGSGTTAADIVTDIAALQAADELFDGRLNALEVISGQSHIHLNKDVLDDITEAKVSSWDAAEQNAKDYADGLASNYDVAGAAASAETAAKAYADGLVENIKPYEGGVAASITMGEEDNYVVDVKVAADADDKKNFLDVNTSNELEVTGITLDAAKTSKDIVVEGGAWADSVKQIFGGTVPAGTTWEAFLEKMLCVEKYAGTITTSSAFTVSLSSTLNPGFDKSGTVEVGTKATLSKVTGLSTTASQSLTAKTFTYGYKLGEDGGYKSATAYTETLTPSLKTSSKALKVTFSGVKDAVNSGNSLSTIEAEGEIAAKEMYIMEGENKVVVSQTGDTYTSSSAVTAGTIYVATNLKNYYKSDEVTPNTYTPTFNSIDKTATGTKEYKVTGATKYFIGDIVDKNENGYWDTDRSELVRGLTTTGWTTSNTISNVVHTYKVGTKQQAVVVPAKYTSVSGKDANQGDVAFNLVKTFDFTNAQGYISSYKVFVAPADDGLGSDSKITITIQK